MNIYVSRYSPPLFSTLVYLNTVILRQSPNLYIASTIVPNLLSPCKFETLLGYNFFKVTSVAVSPAFVQLLRKYETRH